jgi:hypothetical protein
MVPISSDLYGLLLINKPIICKVKLLKVLETHRFRYRVLEKETFQMGHQILDSFHVPR